MCNATNQLKFCTCLDEKDRKRLGIQKSLDKFRTKTLPKSKEPFSWTLYEFSGDIPFTIDGFVNFPSNKAGDELTEEQVLAALNNHDCFDFNYQPKEGDNLRIIFQKNRWEADFLSFLYQNNNWVADKEPAIEGKIAVPLNFGILKVSE